VGGFGVVLKRRTQGQNFKRMGSAAMTADNYEGGALAGLRLLDLTMYLPGPYATLLLADFGADVLTIEPPSGDLARHIAPPVGTDSALHNWVARNKRSCVLDLKSESGRASFRELVSGADVVLEGFTPGVAERLGVDYKSCCHAKPDIVYCSISGGGHGHPLASTPGHDINYLALAGFLDQTLTEEGSPATIGPPIADIAAGLHAAVGILAALRHRDAGGGGQFVDVSIMGAALALTAPQQVKAAAPIPLDPSRDHNLGTDPAYRLYRTRDRRFVAIGAFEDKYWVRLCDALGRRDLVPLRSANPRAAITALRTIFGSGDLAEWNEMLLDADVCYSPVNQIRDVPRDRLAKARDDFVTDVAGGSVGIGQLHNPIRMSKTPARLRSAAPALGEHPALWL
jgi:crotonobetainyl-CoA:carnitine CoA-transferase CaiB-like acyl-CoA transferase